MSKNISKDDLQESLIRTIERLERELRELKSKRLSVPKVAGTPANVKDGDIWYDTTSNVFKKRQNGVTKNWETA